MKFYRLKVRSLFPIRILYFYSKNPPCGGLFILYHIPLSLYHIYSNILLITNGLLIGLTITPWPGLAA